MASILSTSYVHVHTRTVNVCAMLMISYSVRHIKIRAIWLAEMQSSFAERKKIVRGPAARGQSVHGSVYCAYKWGVSQTDDSPSLIGLTPWRTMWSVCSRLRLLRVQLWGVSQTNDLDPHTEDPHTVGKSMKRPFHWCTGEGRTTCKSGIIRSQSLSFVLRLNLYS